MSGLRAGGRRWAVSFADLALLLLGFSLLAQVHRNDGAAVAETIRSHLGGAPTVRHAIDPARMFEPGEAVLRERAPPLGRFAADERIIVESRGTDPGSARFDGWELAAARTAALARAIAAAGATPDRIAIDMAESQGDRQRLTIVRQGR